MANNAKNEQQIAFGLKITTRIVRGLALLFFALFLIIGALVAGIGTGYFNSMVSDTKLPSKKELSNEINDIAEVSSLRYSNGHTIAKIKSDLIRTTVTSDKIAPIMKKALIATEDEYFYKHKGIVPKALFRALLSDALGIGNASGGSTLTQQLVKQQILGDDPTLKRKANEILYATQIEKYFSKDEIITTYLNVAPFGRNNNGENIAGIEEAAKGIFGVSTTKLSIAQAAFLAGLPQSPIVYSPFTTTGSLKDEENLKMGIKRAQNVLFNMLRERVISQDEYDEAMKYDYKAHFLKKGSSKVNDLGYLYTTVLDQAVDIIAKILAKEDGLKESELNDKDTYKTYYENAKRKLQHSGYKVTSTIDQKIYSTMQKTVREYGYLLDQDNLYGTVQTGNVLLNNETGAILGFIGGRNYAKNQNNHAFYTTRSPGSTIKPLLVYGPALDQGLVGSATKFSNFPTSYPDGTPILHDGNSGTNTFMDMREALEWSWNVPAYETYQMLLYNGVSTKSYMKNMGFEISDYSIASLPMGGGASVTTLQQTNGFQTIANDGVYNQQYLISKITDAKGNVIYKHKVKKKRIYSSATASILQNLLRSVLTSNITTTFNSRLSAVGPSLLGCDWVGKTGTSDEFKDSWLIVSTPQVTLGSWTGYDDNSPLTKNCSINNSQFMALLTVRLNSARPDLFDTSQKFTLDPAVITSQVNEFTGELPGKVMVNGKEKTTPGKTVTSYWAKNGAPQSTFDFGIGGTTANYTKAWSNPNDTGTNPLEKDGLKKDKKTTTTSSQSKKQ